MDVREPDRRGEVIYAGGETATQAQTDDKQFPAGQIKRAFGRTEKVQKQKN